MIKHMFVSCSVDYRRIGVSCCIVNQNDIFFKSILGSKSNYFQTVIVKNPVLLTVNNVKMVQKKAVRIRRNSASSNNKYIFEIFK